MKIEIDSEKIGNFFRGQLVKFNPLGFPARAALTVVLGYLIFLGSDLWSAQVAYQAALPLEASNRLSRHAWLLTLHARGCDALLKVSVSAGLGQTVVEHASACIMRGDKRPEMRMAMARGYVNQGRVGDAIDQVVVATQLAPQDGLILVALGKLFEQAKKDDMAAQAYRKAMQVASAQESVLLEVGNFFAKLKDPSMVAQIGEGILALPQPTPEALAAAARAFKFAGLPQKSQVAVDRLKGLAQGNAELEAKFKAVFADVFASVETQSRVPSSDSKK